MKKYYLSVASIFKNESWGLKEWLDHYKFHGVDHVYLVNDFSTDDYMSILKSYIDSGFVTLFQNDITEQYIGKQIDVNNKFFKPILSETRWIAQIDCDEYLYSPKCVNLKKIFEKYESFAAVIANWVWLNSNGHVNQPPSIVKYFTKRCEYDASVIVNSPIRGKENVKFDAPKMILNTDFKIHSFDIHTARFEGNSINLSYPRLSDPELLINHYQIQSKQYWREIKMKRLGINNINPIRTMENHTSLDIGDIEDTRLWEQNKNIKTIGMNNLGKNGRLGNQMFQYAALMGISKNKGFDHKIPDTCDLVQCFELQNSNNNYGIIDGDEVHVHDTHEFCEELFDQCPDGVTLHGYFQTEKYFKNVEDLIRSDFKFKKEIEEEVDFYYGNRLKENPVSICVREFNDYFDYPGCHNNHRNIPFGYFERGIEILGKDRTYIICSNNIELCKDQKVFSGKNFIFNDISTKVKKSYFDLCLISKCKDFIISNSTFSWWGAWLGSHENKRIIAPNPWYGPGLSHISTRDLFPNSWEII